DPSVGRFYKHDSPYTYFSSTELHLGEISLECSRPGAAAVALWATQRLLPLMRGGEFARMLERGRAAALALHAKLAADKRFLTAFPPELDIVVWMPRAKRASEASPMSRRIFDEAGKRDLHLAVAALPAATAAAAAAFTRSPTPTSTRSSTIAIRASSARRAARTAAGATRTAAAPTTSCCACRWARSCAMRSAAKRSRTSRAKARRRCSLAAARAGAAT